jgi:isopenicillin N synthase-like dioxygenase
MRKAPNFKGYSPLLSGNNDPENKGDLQEGFDLGWEALHSNHEFGSKPTGIMAGDNVWPSELPEFREAVLEY